MRIFLPEIGLEHKLLKCRSWPRKNFPLYSVNVELKCCTALKMCDCVISLLSCILRTLINKLFILILRALQYSSYVMLFTSILIIQLYAILLEAKVMSHDLLSNSINQCSIFIIFYHKLLSNFASHQH
jgi:hypothetical protein